MRRASTIVVALAALGFIAPHAAARDAFQTPGNGQNLGVWRITNEPEIRHWASYHNTRCFSPDGRSLCYPMRQGYGVLPGAADTYQAYGEAWANLSNTPFREYKHWVHEGGISTPLIAHWPSGIPAARHNALEPQPGHLIDLMATCVDLAGATYPKEVQGQPITPMEGVSLRPAFAGMPLNRPQPIFWEHEGNRAMRAGKWKLVAKSPAGSWELYDMETDRTEINNLAAQQPERVQQMVAAWEAWARHAQVIPWIWNPPYGEPAANAPAKKAGKKKAK